MWKILNKELTDDQVDFCYIAFVLFMVTAIFYLIIISIIDFKRFEADEKQLESNLETMSQHIYN